MQESKSQGNRPVLETIRLPRTWKDGAFRKQEESNDDQEGTTRKVEQSTRTKHFLKAGVAPRALHSPHGSMGQM